MAGRIVLFGATGFTGELTARRLVALGASPLLVARSRERVQALAGELGGLDSAVADVSQPATLSALLQPGDVLVTTVGPFLRWGEPAVRAAIGAGAHYIDSTGEPPFIRSIFERFGSEAQDAGVGLVTAFGYDYVPGNLAGALALREAGERATRVDVGYFVSVMGNPPTPQVSGGTRASVAGMMTEPGYAFRDGRIVGERGARNVRELGGRPTVSIGASEQFALPRVHPGLRDVGVWAGWFGPASRPLQVISAATSLATKVPGVRGGVGMLTGRLFSGSTGGPAPALRAQARARAIAIASDAGGRALSTVRLEGPNPYDFTADMLAWGAIRTLAGGLQGSGALGPVDGFGLDELERGAAAAGLRRTTT